jgi:ComF family protein
VLAVALGATCASCGELLEHPTHGPVCDRCWRAIRALPPSAFQVSSVIDRAQAIGAHEDVLRSIVHSLKYDGRRSLARPLGSLIRERCRWVLDGADLLVPVPLHSSRMRTRGFNQALDLARSLDLPVARAIRRVRATESQTGLSADERRRNIRGAFAGSRLRWRASKVDGRVVVLVDDVSTTGATLDECARVLSTMGAREVRAVTAARAALSRR